MTIWEQGTMYTSSLEDLKKPGRRNLEDKIWKTKSGRRNLEDEIWKTKSGRQNLENPIFQIWESGKLDFPDFQIEIWEIQNLENPKSGKLEFARSGIWEIRFSRFGI